MYRVSRDRYAAGSGPAAVRFWNTSANGCPGVEDSRVVVPPVIQHIPLPGRERVTIRGVRVVHDNRWHGHRVGSRALRARVAPEWLTSPSTSPRRSATS